MINDYTSERCNGAFAAIALTVDSSTEDKRNGGDLNEQHPFDIAFSALAEAGLRPCLMRASAEHYKMAPEVDIIVLPNELHQVCSVLHSLGWEILDKGWFSPSRKHFLFFWANEFLKIDLYTSLVDASLEYMKAEPYIARSRLVAGGILVPSDADWLFHVVINTILEKDKLKGSHAEKLRTVARDPYSFQAAKALAASAGLSELFDANRGFEWLDDPASVSSARARTVKILANRGLRNRLRARCLPLIKWVGKNLGLRRGFSIAFVGPDGSGKTTLLAALEAAFNDHGIHTHCVYMGPWDKQFLWTSMALARLGANPRDFDSSGLSLSKRLKAHARRWLFYLNFLPETWARYLVLVRPYLLRRQIVLLDRHVFDLEAGYFNEPMKNLVWVRRVLVRLSPRPHLSILLDNDAETIWKRKKEFPLALIQSSLAFYHQAARRYGMLIIRTEPSPERLAAELIATHWRDFVRWRREGLFR